MRLQKPDFLIFLLILISTQMLYAQAYFTVDNLPKIPDKDGFAGSLSGVSNGALMVAGGSNFPDAGRPWTGDTKQWYDDVFVLENPKGAWRKVGKLPAPLGYTVSVTWKDGVVCVGGSHSTGHLATGFIMRWQNKIVTFEPLPNLPITLANSCGALVGDVLYVAGGLENPASTTTLKKFYALNLAAKERKWEELPPWQGEGRMLSVAGSYNGKFYLISGTSIHQNDSTGATDRGYLKDAYCYSPKTRQWKPLTDLPQPTVAAPGPVFIAHKKMIVLGGDTGENASKNLILKDKHPGFSTKIWGFDFKSNDWQMMDDFPVDIRSDAESFPNQSTYLPVTTPLVAWKGGFVIPGGEARPGTRTPRVLWIKTKP